MPNFAYFPNQAVSDKILNQLKSSLWNKFLNTPDYNWFERHFCKNIIKRIAELESKTGKPIKWQRYVNKRRAK